MKFLNREGENGDICYDFKGRNDPLPFNFPAHSTTKKSSYNSVMEEPRLFHTNYKGQTYFVYERKTKTGKTTYTCNQKPEGGISSLPAGYEIHENPNGQVFCRKKFKSLILKDEIDIVESSIREMSSVKYFKLDIKEERIDVYTSDVDPDRFRKTLPIEGVFGDFLGKEVQDKVLKTLEGKFGKDVVRKKFDAMEDERTKRLLMGVSYSSSLRYVLIDPKKRTFVAERFCYLGSIDDWISILAPGSLKKLLKATVKHLDQESFFELM